MKKKRFKLLACDVFARLAYYEAAKSPNRIDLELLPMLAHNEPDKLRKRLQAAINKASEGCESGEAYDKIILAYGLCGNAVMNLSSPIPMVIPRMHDCCAMFMGSQEKFLQVFGHRLSTPWRSCGYVERAENPEFDMVQEFSYKLFPDYLKMVNEYGEENAEYIWVTMNPPAVVNEAVYIQLQGFEYNDTQKYYIDQKAEEGCSVETVLGDSSWFKRLVNGPWDSSEFLEISPGNKILPLYDMEEVFREETCDNSY